MRALTTTVKWFYTQRPFNPEEPNVSIRKEVPLPNMKLLPAQCLLLKYSQSCPV